MVLEIVLKRRITEEMERRIMEEMERRMIDGMKMEGRKAWFMFKICFSDEVLWEEVVLGIRMF